MTGEDAAPGPSGTARPGSEDTGPEDTGPEDAVPDDAVAGDPVRDDAPREGAVPRGAVSEDAVPGRAGPEATVPGDAVPDDDASGAGLPPDGAAEAGGGSAPGRQPATAGDPSAAGQALDDVDREILALENLQWKYQGAKEMEIRRRLKLSPTHYYQRLNVLIDTRAALEHDPMLVARLRRQRGDRG